MTIDDLREMLRQLKDKQKEDPFAHIPETHVAVIHPRIYQALRDYHEQERAETPYIGMLHEVFWIESLTRRKTYIDGRAPDTDLLYMSEADYKRLYPPIVEQESESDL